ncbi:MAG: hypothetical protein ACLP29_00725 [Dissulfurispiraceae bacterium]
MSNALAVVENCEETDVQSNTRFNVYKGWLIPYLVCLDMAFNNGRWAYWLNCLRNKEIPQCELPQIKFLDGCSGAQAREAMKHIEGILNHLELESGSWDGLNTFLKWLLWGLGEEGDFPNISEELHLYLYKTFNMGLLIQAPHDYFGDIISERKSNGWNPHAFFPTPHSVVEFMVQSTVGGDNEKGIFATFLDPCLGSGRMPLHFSNRGVFLYGMDIDPTMVLVSKVNMHL